MWLGGSTNADVDRISACRVYNYFIFRCSSQVHLNNSPPIQSNHKSSSTNSMSGCSSGQKKQKNDMDFYLNQPPSTSSRLKEEIRVGERETKKERERAKCKVAWWRQRENHEQMFWQHLKTKKNNRKSSCKHEPVALSLALRAKDCVDGGRNPIHLK